MKKKLLVSALSFISSYAISSEFYMVVPLNKLITPSAIITGATDFDFGSVNLGSNSTITFNINNNGSASGNLFPNGIPEYLNITGDCGSLIAPGESCTLIISWIPQEPLTINEEILIGDELINFKGTAIKSPANIVGAFDYNFGTISLPNQGVVSLNLVNTGQSEGTILSSNLPADLVKSGNCGIQLAPGENCVLTLIWSPRSPYSLNTSLQVGNSPISLYGTAVDNRRSNLTSSVSSLSYGPYVQGTNSTKSITVMNTGDKSTSVTVTTPSGFSQSNNCGILAAGASCTVSVTHQGTNATGSVVIRGEHNSVTVGASGSVHAANEVYAKFNYSHSVTSCELSCMTAHVYVQTYSSNSALIVNKVNLNHSWLALTSVYANRYVKSIRLPTGPTYSEQIGSGVETQDGIGSMFNLIGVPERVNSFDLILSY